MKLQTEFITDSSMTLIVGDPSLPLVRALASYFQSRNAKVVLTTHIPPHIGKQVARCFCFTSNIHLAEDAKLLKALENVILVSSVKGEPSARLNSHIHLITKHFPQTKVALIPEGNHDMKVIVERLLYFSFEHKVRHSVITSAAILKQTESSLPPSEKDSWHPPSFSSFYINTIKNPLRVIRFVFVVIIIIHTIFLIPLGYASITTAINISYISKQFGDEVADSSAKIFDPFAYQSYALSLSQRLYRPIRKGWLFIGLATYPERLSRITENVIETYYLAQQMREDTSVILAKMMDPQSVGQDKIIEKKESLLNSLGQALENVQALRTTLPTQLLAYRDIGSQMRKAENYLSLAIQFLNSFEIIFAQDGEKLYAIFFANDRELRPGGGFIGSFALVKVKNLQINEWKTYDVYDADGQLQARVRPPDAISTYLQQPYYFLRDSAFTPDFPTNALVAEDFLKKEMGITGIDGAVLLTFASIEDMFGKIGTVQIPEYNERITKENIYLKTQLYAEKDFFPGSIQKKSFIEALTNQLLLKFEDPKVAYASLQSLIKSFDRKQVSIYAKDPSVQAVFDTYYWSGRQLPPNCITQNIPSANACIPLYIFPVEANLGVNKANAFVTRDYLLKTKVIPQTSHVESEFTTYFENKSMKGLFPGGPYKNYYQIFLPPDVQIQSITIDGSVAKKPEIEQNKYTRIGMLVEIPESSRKSVTIKFRTLQSLPSNDSQIQIIFQKQLGLPVSNVSFKFGFPEGYKVSETNFSPLAESRVFEYNSAVDSDKFYYLHF